MPPHALEVLVTVVAAAHLPVKGAPDTKVFVELTHGPVTQESARVPSRANADWAGQELLLPLQHLPLQSDTMHVKVYETTGTDPRTVAVGDVALHQLNSKSEENTICSLTPVDKVVTGSKAPEAQLFLGLKAVGFPQTSKASDHSDLGASTRSSVSSSSPTGRSRSKPPPSPVQPGRSRSPSPSAPASLTEATDTKQEATLGVTKNLTVPGAAGVSGPPASQIRKPSSGGPPASLPSGRKGSNVSSAAPVSPRVCLPRSNSGLPQDKTKALEVFCNEEALARDMHRQQETTAREALWIHRHYTRQSMKQLQHHVKELERTERDTRRLLEGHERLARTVVTTDRDRAQDFRNMMGLAARKARQELTRHEAMKREGLWAEESLSRKTVCTEAALMAPKALPARGNTGPFEGGLSLMERWEADVRGALMEAEAMHWSTMCAQVKGSLTSKELVQYETTIRNHLSDLAEAEFRTLHALRRQRSEAADHQRALTWLEMQERSMREEQEGVGRGAVIAQWYLEAAVQMRKASKRRENNMIWQWQHQLDVMETWSRSQIHRHEQQERNYLLIRVMQDLQGVLAPGAVCGASLSGDDAASSRVHPQALWKALTVADGDKPDMEPGTLVPPGATLPALTRAVQFMGDKWDRQLRVIYSRGWQDIAEAEGHQRFLLFRIMVLERHGVRAREAHRLQSQAMHDDHLQASQKEYLQSSLASVASPSVMATTISAADSTTHSIAVDQKSVALQSPGSRVTHPHRPRWRRQHRNATPKQHLKALAVPDRLSKPAPSQPAWRPAGVNRLGVDSKTLREYEADPKKVVKLEAKMYSSLLQQQALARPSPWPEASAATVPVLKRRIRAKGGGRLPSSSKYLTEETLLDLLDMC
uniref:C2 domain-containing protein n=1 Tax=Eutreptiella gymnastica TaxID=73025 RepID=A0A7S4C9R4_9EUGL|mmetsp:Transcript_25983/g.44222  ORF Transcript_25983/g.44222 Transcript_25983/m.44222 type:complete len:876 (+) Transcript_25983:123-2750(+)